MKNPVYISIQNNMLILISINIDNLFLTILDNIAKATSRTCLIYLTDLPRRDGTVFRHGQVGGVDQLKGLEVISPVSLG